MCIEGQGHFFTIYFPGFVCFVLYWAKISGERSQDHWSFGLTILHKLYSHCEASEDGQRLEILDLGRRGIALSIKGKQSYLSDAR